MRSRSEAFHERLLGGSPSGFSVYGRQVAHADEPGKLERLSRYITRAPFSLGKIRETQGGRVETPTHPRTRAPVHGTSCSIRWSPSTG